MTQMDEQDARDLLIRVDTKVSLLYENFIKLAEKQEGDRQTIDLAVKAAHRRIDGLLISGILTIIIIIISTLFNINFGK